MMESLDDNSILKLLAGKTVLEKVIIAIGTEEPYYRKLDN